MFCWCSSESQAEEYCGVEWEQRVAWIRSGLCSGLAEYSLLWSLFYVVRWRFEVDLASLFSCHDGETGVWTGRGWWPTDRHFVCAMSRHAVAVDWNEAVGTDGLTGGLTSGPWDSKVGLLLCWVSVFRSPGRDSVAKMDSTVCVKGTRYDARRVNCGHGPLAMTMRVTGL